MKTVIDFQVLETFDTRYLSVADYSDWGLAFDRKAIIEITVPGFTEPVTHYFDKKSINRFNSRLLGLNYNVATDLDLPDGIYTITVKASPDTYQKTRTFLKTTQTKLNLDTILINNISSCSDIDKTIVDEVLEIEMLIKSAEANVRYGNECEAFELFQKAQKLIDRKLKC